MMVQYLAAFRNEKGRGPVAELFSTEEDEIRAFVARHDRPGFAVYRCVSPLKEGATRRSLETVGEIDKFVVDLDHKDLEEDPERIDDKLLQLPLPATFVRDSGHGRHLELGIKEPIGAADPEFPKACELLKRLTRCLSGDPAPAHPAALIREPGTHNSKNGDAVPVQALWGSGQAVDVSEIEALCDLLPEEGIFTRKLVNGRDRSPSAGEAGAPINVDELLAGASPGDVNLRTLRATGHLIRTGSSVDDDSAARSRGATPRNPRRIRSEWRTRQYEIEGQCYRLIRKEPDLYDRLPDGLRVKWERYLDEGRKPYLLWTQLRGWEVRRCKPGAEREQPQHRARERRQLTRQQRPGVEQAGQGRDRGLTVQALRP